MNSDTKSPLIVFGEDWGRHPSSTQHLIKRLMGERQILWANSIGMRRPRLSDLGRLVSKLRAMSAAVEETANDQAMPQAVVSPKAVSWPGSKLASFLNRKLIAGSLKPHMDKLNFDKPILWVSLPTAVDTIGTLDEIAVVYYAGDDFGALSGVDHEPVLEMEARLVEKADVIIAASPVIAERFPRGKTFVIPHGVDVDHFSTPEPGPADLDMVDGRPVAGFYGAIDTWLNQELIAETAALLPSWRFVFVGPVRTDVQQLAALENVEFLGPKEHSDLPGYVQNWDVSLLPFLKTQQIEACNPLKLREYLAAGTPVVSTSFPAAQRFDGHIRFAETAAAFAEAIEASLSEPKAARAARVDSVRGQTWEARAKEVGILLDALSNGHASTSETEADHG